MLPQPVHDRRVALSVTTVGMLAATLNSSILLISLPAIFNGLGLDPLAPSQHLLPALDVDGLPARHRRAGGDVRPARRPVRPGPLFNLGFLIFTVASIACALVPNGGSAGALELIVLRVVQGVGGAMITANSTAIITDAFPPDRRGFALGVNQVGRARRLVPRPGHRRRCLSEWHWRAVFWVSVPVGVWGTWMGYRTLHDNPRDRDREIIVDWWGNVTFGVGLIAAAGRASRTGCSRYGGHTMGWTSPRC